MRTLRHAAAASTLGLLFLASCAGPKAEAGTSGSTAAMAETRTLTPVDLSNEITATADVTAVDKGTRVVTLRREDGSMFQVLAGSEVRNFDQIKAGDKLRVRFKENLKASLRPANEGGPQAGAGVVATRAAVGATPAAGAAFGVSVKVRIESIDSAHDIVVFSLPSGELVSHRIATSEGKKFVEGLKIGDKVQLEYSQALALAIEKV
jgi:hypothetical protein